MNSLLNSLIADIGLLAITAGSIERIMQIAKNIINKYYKKKLSKEINEGTIIALSIGFCFFANIQIDIFTCIPDYINKLLTGLIVSFGSDFFHQILSILQITKNNKKNK